MTVATQCCGYTCNVTAITKITKDGQPATLADLAVGQVVTGVEEKDNTGKWTVTTLTIGR